MRHGTKRKRVLQALTAGAIMPLLSFCSSGDMAAPTAVATPHVSAAPVVTGPAAIYINEILAHTDEPQVDTLELYNASAAAVDLTGWCISDDKDDVRKYCVPAPAGGAPPAGDRGRWLLPADQCRTGLRLQ